MQPLIESIRIAAPELLLAVSAMALLMLGVFRGDRSLVLLTWLSVIVYAAAGALLFVDLGQGAATAALPGVTVGLSAFDGLYIADDFSVFLKVVIFASAAVAALLAVPYLKRTRTARFEYPVLLMLGTLGMSMMVSANDLLALYLGLELQSLAAYVLAAFHRNEARSSEAGLKYFVLGALASGILLYGVSLIYGFGGTTNFTALGAGLRGGGEVQIGVLFGLVFILAGLAFKVSAVPFHMWTPDVYEGAPTPVAAFFAAAPKVAAMGLLVRVAIEVFGGMLHEWQQIIAFAAIASMILGAVGAIGQKNVKRLLAYSSINNIGFALVGLAAANEGGIAAVLFYMAVYAAMTLGSFLVVLQMRDADGRSVESVESLAGLARTRPALAFAMMVFMFSLAGIPPMLGFWPKLSVFNAAIEANMYVLAVIAVVTSVVGCFYYLRIIKVMYFDEPAPAFAPAESRINSGMIAAAAIFCSPVGMLAITPLVTAATRAAQSIL
ncbi:NADH-quinone oxidoreductase subunit NuoN [Sphingoaurantiacus capsulatus]|uniref:NADH-quinone oxidoreductase subunit N n=1 Tax=Sphingoaurantiacus capsulatus TaxID=1771310 RepID=A0ABV7XCK8_9SPHN